MRRNLIPVILIIVGVLLIVGAIGWSLSQYSNVSQPEPPSVESQDNYPDIPRVSVSDAKDAFDTGSAVFVDVREVEEYEQGHISGAIVMPLAEVPIRMDELDPQDWIIPY